MKIRNAMLLTILALCVIILLLPFSVNADGSEIASGKCGENVTWVLTKDGTLTISGTGEMYDLRKTDKAKWTGHCSIKTVVIEPGVTYIGQYAFYKTNGTNSITSVSIPDTVEKIGNCAFFSQPIVELVIPDSVYYIGESAFAYCRQLEKLTVNAFTIDDYAFQQCYSLTELTIGSKVNQIGAGAFGAAYETTVMPRKNVYIDSLWNWCRITFDTSTSNPLFYGADLYEDGKLVTELKGISLVKKYAFYGYEHLKSIDILDGGIIERSAFKGCTGLTDAAIGAKSIGEEAFYGLSNLTNVTFGASVTNIEMSAFEECGLTSVVFAGNEDAVIGMNAFNDCDGLTYVNIGTVSSIKNYAFGFCDSLTDVTIGSATIGESAFSCCSAMTDLVVEAGTVGDEAFRMCTSLARVTLGSGVTSIGKNAFGSCRNIQEMTIPFVGMQHDIPGYFESFFTASLNGSVSGRNVPDSLRTVTILDGCTKIASNAFFGCDMITTIYLPESLTDIGYGAFWACDNLKLITIGSGVTEIDYATFNECDELWHVLFTGTEEQWNAITVGDSNSILETVKVHYNCTGNETIDAENKVCSICRDNCEHIWDGGVVTKEATCGEAGAKTYTCTICGTTKEEAIEALGHDAVTDVAVAPTCTETGLTEGSHCAVCGEVLVAQTVVEATGHSHTSEVTTAPGCETAGVMTYICSVCGDSYTEEIAATGHAYSSVVTAPTCTENGYTTHTCTTCGASYTDNHVEALGHQHEAVVTEPTCTEAGCTTYTCHCGDTYSEEIPALDHSFVDGTCERCGAPEVEIGDVNGDGRINVRDARTILRYIAGLITEDELELSAADFNGDGRVNVRDARAILKYIAGMD